ncbi:putative histidine acid phosphatase [Dipodascopsis uninucleata]
MVSPTLSLALACIAAVPAAAKALSPIDTFYPPNINSTKWISDSSLGTYGGIYAAPREHVSAVEHYGIYDYCTMPHPRKTEYELPKPVANHDVKAKIVYLEYLQRHQRRTPYNLFPGGEAHPYWCDDIQPFLYAGGYSAIPPIPVFAQTYTDPSNPFVDSYINGTCQFPQLTLGGYLDGYQHGRDLWGVYGEKLGLFPKSPYHAGVWFRSSESALTQQSAGGVLRGIWPEYQGSLALHQQTSAVDTVNEGYSCSAISSTQNAYMATEEWQAHLNATADLRARLGDMFGATSSDWQSTFDHFSDNFQGRLCNGYSLPCTFNDTSKCVSEKDAYEVFRAGDWEWNYYWRTNPYVAKYITLVEGLFIGEIVSNFEAVLRGDKDYVFRHTFVHDGDIGPVLGALGIKALRWPAMASNIAFEIWETSKSQHYVRVLYSGHTLKTIYGDLEWMPLTQLIKILKKYVPDDIIALCNE